MHIEARILKRRSHGKVTVKSPSVQLELMSQTHPVLLLRIVRLNSPGEPFSLQFVATDGAEYHYSNFSFDPSYDQDAVLEDIALAELPESSTRSWQLIAFPPTDSTFELGVLIENNGWTFEPSHSTQNNEGSESFHPTIAFIGGPPKSGTTWVQGLVNSHPDALATGENNLLDWPSRDLMYDLMMANSPPQFAHAVPHSPYFQDQINHFYVGRAEAILTQLANFARVKVVADKTPANGSSFPWIASLRPAWVYIHCVRHPLDVVVSRFFHERRLLIDTPHLSIVPPDVELRRRIITVDPDHIKKGVMFETLLLFNLFIDAALVGCEGLDLVGVRSHSFSIRYEELVASPEHAISDLYRALGLSTDTALVADAVRRNCFEYFSGGRSRGSADGNSFFRKGVTGDYKTYLADEQIAYATARIRLATSRYDSYFE